MALVSIRLSRAIYYINGILLLLMQISLSIMDTVRRSDRYIV